MKNEIIDRELLIKALSNEWKTASQLREELGIDASSKKIGQALRILRQDHPGIETEKHKHTLFYRMVKAPQPLQERYEVSVIPAKPKDIKKEIISLAHELKDRGLNPDEICYKALWEYKERFDSEYKMVMEKAPIIVERNQKLIDENKDLKNQLQDMRDRIAKIESKDMIKRISEERKAKDGILK